MSRFGPFFPHTDTRWFASPGFVVGVDLEGHIIEKVADEDGRFLATTTALEHDGYLYLGSVVMPAVGRIRLPGVGMIGEDLAPSRGAMIPRMPEPSHGPSGATDARSTSSG